MLLMATYAATSNFLATKIKDESERSQEVKKAAPSNFLRCSADRFWLDALIRNC